MRPVFSLILLAAAASPLIFAAEPQAPSIGKLLDGQIRQVESEVVSLAEAMPADKFNFAPTSGEFKGVRTFSQQMTHIATVIYQVSSGALGEKCPVEIGENENGAPSIQGKDAVVKYLKDSFAYGHKAAGAMTNANMMDLMPSPFGGQKAPRVSLVSMIPSHTFDHYGQAVVYARMNRIVPPASR
ncbi:MAG TPA: DinB family protein [Bryobacteraceae bacterium]|nr:DinB family protein [Bryobacteraceae bacterium]